MVSCVSLPQSNLGLSGLRCALTSSRLATALDCPGTTGTAPQSARPERWRPLEGVSRRAAADTARCCPQQAAAYAATSADRQARSSGTQDHRWDLYSDPALAALALTPTVWPVVLELTRNQPMIRLGIGIHDAPRSGGGGMLHCNREFQRSSALGSSSMASYST